MAVFALLFAGATMPLPGGGGVEMAAAGPGSRTAGGGLAILLPYGGTLSHVAVGGPWKTVLTLVNVHVEKPAECELRFWSSGGEPMEVTLSGGEETRTGSVFPVSLPPLGSVRLTTVSGDPEVRSGWAMVERKEGKDCFTSAFGSFRAVLPGLPDYESLVVSESVVEKAVAPFDNRNGFGTAVAVVNPYRSDPLDLDIEIYGRDGQLVAKYRERLEKGGHAAFPTAEKWPATSGRDGIIRIRRANGGGFTALALLFNPSGSVTTLPVAGNR